MLLALTLVGCSAQSRPAPEAAPPDAPAAAGASPTAVIPPTSAIAPLPDVFSGQAALEHVRQLSAVIGSRPTGTASERQAADYIADRLRSYGYEVELQHFEFEDYEERSAALEVAPQGRKIETNALYFSAGGDVTAPLVAAGIGRLEDFPPQSRGAVALVERGTLQFNEKVTSAQQMGAVAVVVYNNVPGEFRGTLGRQNGSSVPVVGITQEEGQQLLAALKQGEIRVRVQVDAGLRTITSQNVVARGGPACKVVVGGHYDSVAQGPGANDNASGTAATIEAARVLKARAAAEGLCFIAFGGEELGLWGSRRYVASLNPEEKAQIKGMINLDMVAVGDSWRLFGSESMLAVAEAAAQSLSVPATTTTTLRTGSGGSDHASFIQAGIPAVFFYRMDDPNYHTAQDKLDFIDATALEAAGRMTVETINRLK